MKKDTVTRPIDCCPQGPPSLGQRFLARALTMLDRERIHEDIGPVFRQIRESRHISLEEATGGEFSRSHTISI